MAPSLFGNVIVTETIFHVLPSSRTLIRDWQITAVSSNIQSKTLYCLWPYENRFVRYSVICPYMFIIHLFRRSSSIILIALSLLKVAKIFRISRDASPPLSWNSNITNFVVAIKLQSSKYSWLQWLHILSTKLGIRQAVPKIRTNNWAKLLS